MSPILLIIGLVPFPSPSRICLRQLEEVDRLRLCTDAFVKENLVNELLAIDGDDHLGIGLGRHVDLVAHDEERFANLGDAVLAAADTQANVDGRGVAFRFGGKHG
jgi:hypothetical protein